MYFIDVVVGVDTILIIFFKKIIVKTQRNSTQLNATLKQLALELDTGVTRTPPHPPPTNFSPTSRQARELKFGTDTHLANLIRKR